MLLAELFLVALIVLNFWQTANYKIVRDWTTLNYVTLATESACITFFLCSLLMAILVSVFLVVIAWPIAFFVVRFWRRYKLIFSLLLAVPILSGEVLRLIALQGMLGPTGLINCALLRMGRPRCGLSCIPTRPLSSPSSIFTCR